MKILYGVQATGNGHISRSREMVRELRDRGHELQVLFSGRSAEELWDVEDFRPYEVRRGFSFSVNRGKIRFLKTALNLRPLTFLRDLKSIDPKGIDLVISDYEPVSAYFARKNNIFSIGVGHQYAFAHPVPIRASDPGSRAILKYFAPVDLGIGLHWHHFNAPVLPPIVPAHLDIHEQVAAEEPFHLVYLGFEKSSDYEKILLQFPLHQFVVYSSEKGVMSKGNVRYKGFSRHGFLQDLLRCEGVICNAGFELPSEALHLGKKLLVKPLQYQMEQESNAAALEKLGLGISMQRLSTEKVGAYLKSERPPAKNWPNIAGIIAEWITENDFSDFDTLLRRAWQEA